MAFLLLLSLSKWPAGEGAPCLARAAAPPLGRLSSCAATCLASWRPYADPEVSALSWSLHLGLPWGRAARGQELKLRRLWGAMDSCEEGLPALDHGQVF